MNNWNSATITNKGLALQAKLQRGTTLTLTRAATGSGTVSASQLESQTGISNEMQELVFGVQSYPEAGMCAVPLKLNNNDLETGYTAKQIGIYAFDPDEGEILYLISQESDGEGTDIPSKTEAPGFTAGWTFYVQFAQADSVSITVDPSGAVTQEEVDASIEGHDTSTNPHAGVLVSQATFVGHTGNTANPHGVTAAQVGLGNVDNTADANKYVAYASNAGSANRTAYVAIIRFNGGRTEGTDQFTFDGSVSKSINITPANIGAADAAHEHSDLLSKSGGAMTGALTLNGIILTEGVDYGTTLPSNVTNGKLFIKIDS